MKIYAHMYVLEYNVYNIMHKYMESQMRITRNPKPHVHAFDGAKGRFASHLRRALVSFYVFLVFLLCISMLSSVIETPMEI